MKRIAIIINGDAETRHVDNVKRALAVQQEEGFEVYVASVENPGVPADHFVESTSKNVHDLLTTLKGKITAEDEIEVYTTGHGDSGKKISTLCLQDGCKDESIVGLIDALPYAKRTVVTDQCYSGNWARRFVDDPKTLFVAAGSVGETVCCQEIAPKFYAHSSKVPDLNGDGKISRQERYAYAVGQGLKSSSPIFIPTDGYVETGNPPFENKVFEFSKTKELTQQLKRLKPGHYAIVTFSADWCGPCKAYAPMFEQLAAKSGGQHLFLHTLNEQVAADYGVTEYPTIMIMNSDGKRYVVENRNRVLGEIQQLGFSQGPVDKLLRRLALIEARDDVEEQTKAIRLFIEDWQRLKDGETKKKVLDRLIDVACTIHSQVERDSILNQIAMSIFAYDDTNLLHDGLRLVQVLLNTDAGLDVLVRYVEWMLDHKMLSQARALLKQGIAVSDKSKNYEDLSALAQTCASVGDKKDIIPLLNHALDVIDGDDKHVKLSALVDKLPKDAGTQAILFLQRVEVEAQQLPNPSARLNVLHSIAEYLASSGHDRAAMAKCEQILVQARQLIMENGTKSQELLEAARYLLMIASGSKNHTELRLLALKVFAEAEASLPEDPEVQTPLLYSIAINRRDEVSKGELRRIYLRMADSAGRMVIRNGFHDQSWYLEMASVGLKDLGFKDDARMLALRAIGPTVQIVGETRARWIRYLVFVLKDLGLAKEANDLSILVP